MVVPAYNAAAFLEETIRSVLSQTHARLELLLVDDGSTDSTPEICAKYAALDARVRPLRQENSGVSVARNTGIAAAHGEFLAFLDADDIWTPDSLSRRLALFASDPNLGVVQCDYVVIDAASRQHGEVVSYSKQGLILDDLLLIEEGKPLFCISAVLARRDIVEELGGFDVALSNGADHDFFFRAAARRPFGHSQFVGLYYRLHDSNMHSNVELLEKDSLLTFKNVDAAGLFRDNHFRRRCYASLYFMLGGSWVKIGGDPIRGAAYLVRALLTHPPIITRLLKKLL